ncbi:putative zinc finger protein dhhc domain-containing protein [Rosellinia necatrix]|uniref:Putative zinc finger protein dhhc domain-containing protein n=1 Tax=Rosellinia necatrix TaxID=77044 RepID=A0A1W2TIP7_ROSNE|nr:putative zinc finger protein dhhc domain-containing protein [Rosellinia necatrix]
MADHRSRMAGRKSPTFNPARASMPVNIGYNLPYTGELHPVPHAVPHAAPTARYDPSVPRRHDPKTSSSQATPAATVTTTYVTKDPVSRSLSRSNRHRSSTVDTHSGKPIIVTTSHSRPHANPSHASGSARATSPPREPYRPNDEPYYTSVQPASSIRSRSHNRHSYSQGAPVGDEFYRLRERVGGVGVGGAGAGAGGGAPLGTANDVGFWGPGRASTDNFRNPRPHVLYTNTPHHPAHVATPTHYTAPAYPNTSAVADHEDDFYEYTRPGELVRYDLDHDRDRRSRRDSVDRPYYRPHVNVVNHDAGRYEPPRSRAKPPPSAGLEKFNRAAAAGAYDRPSVTMPAPPAVPPPPPIDTSRRPALLEAPRSPSGEARTARPRPVSLYQDGPTRPLHVDDAYRSRDDERVGRDRRERDDGYRDDNVTIRGFGIRTDAPDQHSGRPAQNYDERRPRHEATDRESKRGSDESLVRVRPHDRDATEDRRLRAEDSRDRNDSGSRRESVSRTRDPVNVSLQAGLAALGLAPAPAIGRDETNVSPRRRASDEEKEYSSRATEASKSREKDSTERKLREDRAAFEQRREPRRDRTESVSGSKDREPGTDTGLELDSERQRDRDYDHPKEPERVRERDPNRGRRERRREHSSEDEGDQRERQRHDGETKSNGSTADKRDASPDDTSNTGRRRQHPPSAFDPTDTKGLMDLKAELAAREAQTKEAEKIDGSDAPSTREPTSTTKAASATNGSDKDSESANESRGREIVPAQEKQVRVVSPPREKVEPKPIKGILKTPSARFPEDQNPIREGVAPHKDDYSKKDVPAGARWTKISRKKVNPDALTIGKERFEVRDDFVIVLRVLNKEEIQAYATATAQIREIRRKEMEKDAKSERYSDGEQTRSDEERQRRHRHRQEKEEDDYRRGRAADDKHKRHKYDDDSEIRPKTIEYHSGQHHHRHYDSNAEDRR